MTTLVPDRKGIRRLNTFERHVLRRDELGSIPVFSDDPEEQLLIDETRRGIQAGYDKARAAMVAHLNDQALRIVDLEERLAAATFVNACRRLSATHEVWSSFDPEDYSSG